MPIHEGQERGSEVKLLEIGHSGSRIGTRRRGRPREDHQVPGSCLDRLPGGVAVGGVIDREPLVMQADNDGISETCIVLDDQDPAYRPRCHRYSPPSIHGTPQMLRVRFYLRRFSAQWRILWNSLRHLGRLMDIARALFQIAPVSCE